MECEIDPDEENKFRQEIELIANQALDKIKGIKDKATTSLEYLILSTTKH